MFLPLLTTAIFFTSTFASVLHLSKTSTISDATCDFATFSNLAFNITLIQWKDTFTSQARPACFEWCSDACSSSPDNYPKTQNGPSVSWKPACARHDFSYRNLKRIGQFNEVNKKAADEHLRDGMIELCGKHEVCADAAKHIYYPVVRKYNRPEAEHNKWDEKEGKGNTNCSVFPGCCENHGDKEPCGREPLPGQHKGDGSCVAR